MILFLFYFSAQADYKRMFVPRRAPQQRVTISGEVPGDSRPQGTEKTSLFCTAVQPANVMADVQEFDEESAPDRTAANAAARWADASERVIPSAPPHKPPKSFTITAAADAEDSDRLLQPAVTMSPDRKKAHLERQGHIPDEHQPLVHHQSLDESKL